MTYRTQSADVTPEIEAIVVDGWRRMSPAEKVRQVRELTRTTRRFALAGLRDRHPNASDEELRRRLAAFWLDREMMVRVFGSDGEPWE